MKQLLCWTLASLYNIARFNRPSPSEVSKYNLDGWNSSDWFESEEHQANWANWTNSTWGVSLKAHLSDAFIVTSENPLPLGGISESYKTFNFNLWRISRGDFNDAGSFLQDLVGDYCKEIYPPGPTPTPTPEPVWTHLQETGKVRRLGNINSDHPPLVVMTFENGTQVSNYGGGSLSYMSLNGDYLDFMVIEKYTSSKLTRDNGTFKGNFKLEVSGFTLPVEFKLFSFLDEDNYTNFLSVPAVLDEYEWYKLGNDFWTTAPQEVLDRVFTKGIWAVSSRVSEPYGSGGGCEVMENLDTTDPLHVKFEESGGERDLLDVYFSVVKDFDNSTLTWQSAFNSRQGSSNLLNDMNYPLQAEGGPDWFHAQFGYSHLSHIKSSVWLYVENPPEGYEIHPSFKEAFNKPYGFSDYIIPNGYSGLGGTVATPTGISWGISRVNEEVKLCVAPFFMVPLVKKT